MTTKPHPAEELSMMDFNDKARNMAGYAHQSNTALERAGDAIGWLWAQADAMPDGDLKQNTIAALSVAWEQSQELAKMASESAGLLTEMAAVANDYRTQRNAAVMALEELVQAIETGDDNNPLVADLVEYLSQDLHDYYGEMATEGAFDDAHEAVVENITDNLRQHFGLTFSEAAHFADILTGWRSLTPESARELLDWVKFKADPEEKAS